MRKKIASIVMAGALAFGAVAPTPAFAQNTNPNGPGPNDQLNSSGGLIDDSVFSHLLLIFGLPVIMSSMGSSLLGIEQCGLHDVRGCDDLDNR